MGVGVAVGCGLWVVRWPGGYGGRGILQDGVVLRYGLGVRLHSYVIWGARAGVGAV